MKKQIVEKQLKEVDVVVDTEYFCDKCGNGIVQQVNKEDKNKIVIERKHDCGCQ
jgi:uncharacterized cysteine cluster protein YcgN (CxxCxxCC family)